MGYIYLPISLFRYLQLFSEARASVPNRPAGLSRRYAGRAALGNPSFFKPMAGLEQMEVGPDALPGPIGLCGGFLLHHVGWYEQKLQVHDLSPS